MSIDFSFEAVKEKPKSETVTRKGSKYDPILTAFLESGHKLVRVDNTGLDGNYLRMQLARVIKTKGITSIEASVRNGELYLEKINA